MMSEEDFEEDLQDEDELDNSNVDETDEMELDDEPAVKPRQKKAKAEVLEEVSAAAKAREREALAKQMEEFLARGGKVQEIDSNALGDPPRKPDGKYGSRPI